MKKRIFGLATIAAIVMTLASCTVKVENEIIGTWDDSMMSTTYQFNSGGTGLYWFDTIPNIKLDFSWSINGNDLTITTSAGSVTYDIFIKGSSMIWKISNITVGRLKKLH